MKPPENFNYKLAWDSLLRFCLSQASHDLKQTDEKLFEQGSILLDVCSIMRHMQTLNEEELNQLVSLYTGKINELISK